MDGAYQYYAYNLCWVTRKYLTLKKDVRNPMEFK